MTCRIIIKPPVLDESPLFGPVQPGRAVPGRGLACSLALHALVLLLLPAKEQPPPERQRQVSVMLINPFLVRIPQRQASATPRPSMPRKRRVQRSADGAGAPELPEAPELAARQTLAAPAVSALTLPPRPERAPARQFELPPLPVSPQATVTLLEPDVPLKLETPLDAKLPRVVAWTQSLPDRKPAARVFVVPGAKQLPREVPELAAPPNLSTASATESSPVRLEIAALTPNGVPAPRPAGRPFRMALPAGRVANPAAPLAELQGEPINLLALPMESAPSQRTYEIPRALQVALAHSGPPPALPGNAGGSSAGSKSAANSTGNSTGNGPSTGGSGSTAAGSGSESSPGLAGAVPIRIVHPSNGNFDVVIQSTSSDILPEASGILSGAPIYTVYLPVGGSRQWIMQYCLSGSRKAEGEHEERIVRLGNTPSPKAPYPLVSYVFSLSLPGRTSRYLLLHGYLNKSGSFETLRVVEAGNESWKETLLAALSRWEFRPASLDGLPVTVEVLLAIPIDRS